MLLSGLKIHHHHIENIIDCLMLYYWYQPLITINKPETQRFCPGGEVLPCMGYIGMCGPKEYSFFSRFGHK